MGTLTITAKGQVTLRKDLLEHLGIGPGQQISVEKLPDGKIEVSAAPTGDISAVFGLLHRKGGPTLSIEQMNEIAREGWAGRRSKK
jgi:AbrB family looped-hinge helix DNA binding protein